MYSREKRKKAIELYIKYDKCAADVNHELGYPDRKTLTRWYKKYISNGMYWEGYTRRQPSKYSLGQKETAVEYYLEHGRNLSRTVRALGYPSREALRSWCDELAPGRRKIRIGGAQLTLEQKQEMVFALCIRAGSAENVAKQYGVTREALYNWKSELLREEGTAVKPRKNGKQYPEDKNALLSEIEKLKGQIKRLQLEKDILEGTVDIIKKDPGADPKDLTNREKTILIGALKDRHPLKELLACIGLARSSYFYHSKSILLPDRYEWLRQRLTALSRENKGRYGYRRLHALLAKEGTHISEKVVRHLMKECGLAVLIKRRRYSSYRGENTPAADNIIERDFHADAPNTKWLTDITEFAIPAGKVYLSPIVDCFDGLAVSWSIGTSPDAELVNSMLDQATATLKNGEHPIVHSDRGCHYRWPGWISRATAAGLQRSMSKKGCSPDNAACEGFFGRLKNEMFYNQSWTGVSIEKFIDVLDEYLSWYNEKRIKLSLGAMSPLEFRRSLGLVA